MTKNFVLACGGTGGRCAEALAYLFACRAITDPCHVLIIDPDQGNGNIVDAFTQLQDYATIRSSLLPIARTSDLPFFAATLNEGGGGFFWANPNAEKSWSSILDYGARPDPIRGLLDLFYDSSDLDLSFEEGYVGRAHIGSLDLLRTLEPHLKVAKDEPNPRDALHSFMSALRNATTSGSKANVLVIGSVFGGTGASALPAIPALLAETLGSDLRSRVRLACVQLAPYFTFPEGAAENPDAAIHPIATQAALRYYASTPAGYDRIYLVGAPDRPPTSSFNVRGGGPQRNATHHVELVASLAAAHFFHTAPAARPKVTELFASSARDPLIWNKFPDSGPVNLRQNMVALTTFCLMHATFLSEEIRSGGHRERTWMSVLMRGPRHLSSSEPALDALDRFARRYLVWARAIQRFSGTALFTLDADNAVSARSLASIATGHTAGDSAFDRLMRRLESRLDDNEQGSGVGFYIHALTRAVDEFCGEQYANWTLRSSFGTNASAVTAS